ncbi:helix-turn-helix domain-containing protein [Allokutzneria albata]|uniref:Helix-turn-helix domain-containing protein n=1 Tax=Allokutzneria albata TaxID=211114 RepID=A0A1G9SN65_ALLAB|nr:helix-turn-helix transcriptional regulator [Allokutzneria albata]SDM36862.1 Helix-turn-helix domain-containing protein [Allokutzneria albata]
MSALRVCESHSSDPTGEFAVLLRTLRERACLTQEELAEHSGLSIRAISDLERGRTSKPHRKSVVLLARALGIEGESLEGFRRLARRKVAAAPLGAVRSLSVAPEAVTADRTDQDGTAQLVEWMRQILAEEPGPATGPRMVELVGGPDSDTTGLAVRAVARLRRHFPDGQFYLNVAADARGQAGLVDRLLRVFGAEVDHRTREVERLSVLRSLLRSRRAVLVLDNVQDAAALRPVLAFGSACAVIVIARRRLALFDGVWTIDVPPTRRALGCGETARTA